MTQFWCPCCDHGWREQAAAVGPTRCSRCQAQQVKRYAVNPPKPGRFDRHERQAVRPRRTSV